jgi:SOS-response transcriptional repressor LexA
MTALGQRVKALRKARHLSQGELADAVGVERSYIAMIETGRTKNPSRDVLTGLARALEVPIEDLLIAAGYLQVAPPEAELAEREIATKRLLTEMERLLQEYGTILEVPAERAFNVAGRVPAGYPEIPEAEVVDELIIPASWFVLKVAGDSLNGLGIEHGDQVFIDPTATEPRPQQIVVAQLADGSVTIKRWVPQGDHVRLEPANHKYRAIKARDLRVLGTVKAIWKFVN